MLKIAICDDQSQELEVLNAYLNAYFSVHPLEVEVQKFTHPDTLLSAIENDCYHIYLLDIVMPMVNGLELGREIRRMDRKAQIIYTTTEPQFALQAYTANPINYLLKPIEKDKLYDTLTLAISKIDFAEEATISVKTADSLRVINLSDILCCEYRSHAILFTLKNGEEVLSRTIRDSFTEYSLPLLNDRNFVQCHTAYVIHMRYVERFAKDSFTLKGGKIVPISVRQYATVRDTYMDYLMAKGVH